ncbi:MAG: hypothetical protein AAF519_17035 [Bacteroidota bacterium]
MNSNIITPPLKRLRLPACAFVLMTLLYPLDLRAHVKWFSSFTFLEQSKTTEEVANLTYGGLTALSLVVISLLIILDKKINEATWNKKVNTWLDQRKKYGHYVITIATFTVLFVAWVNDTVLTPELTAKSDLLPWLQFFIALCVLIPVTTAISGVLLIGLYTYCIVDYGFFYMLDYLHFVGIGIYLATIHSNNLKISKSAIPALYVTLGFSLIWLAFEKLYYPSWTLQILEQQPQLAMGFPHNFFIQAAAFVEIGLGFVMLFGALERLVAAIITVVFITSSLFFGKVEIIGHTSLHAILILFILTGTVGVYKPPINRMWTTAKKLILGNLSYLAITLIILFAYKAVSEQQYLWAKEKAARTGTINDHSPRRVEVSPSERIPEVTFMEITKEALDMGYNLQVELRNWTFTPALVGQSYTENQGHIHVYVDGKMAGRMYSNWFYLGDLPKGRHKIAITLNGNDHSAFTIHGQMIGAEREIDVD